MKKKIIILVLIMFCLVGCDDDKYTVTLIDNEKIMDTILVNKGDTIGNIKDPIKEGYLFVNWLINGKDYDKNEPVTDDITLTANWTKIPSLPNNHTVTFNFGSYIKDVTVDDGLTVEKPKEDPVLEKHTFLGWYDGEELYDFDTPVIKDIVLTAKYEKNRVIVNYDLNGGSGTTIQVEIDMGSIPDRPKDPVKFGYKFLNWLLGGQPYNFDFPINEDVTIKANYVAVEYVKVTYNTDGGNEIKSEMIPMGSSLTKLPTPVREGYVFKYWTLLGEKFDVNAKINDDITLVAVYEEKVVEEELSE